MCCMCQQRRQQIFGCKPSSSKQLQGKYACQSSCGTKYCCIHTHSTAFMHHMGIFGRPAFVCLLCWPVCLFLVDQFECACTWSNLLSASKQLRVRSHVQVDHFKQKDNFALLEQARIVYSAGFFLTASPDSILVAAKHAAANNKIYCMNISAPFLLQVQSQAIKS